MSFSPPSYSGNTTKARVRKTKEDEGEIQKSNKGVSTNPKRSRATNPGRKEISNFKTVTDTSFHL